MEAQKRGHFRKPLAAEPSDCADAADRDDADGGGSLQDPCHAFDSGSRCIRAVPMVLRARMATMATHPIVSDMPSASDSSTSPTIAAELWVQAKPSTEVVSGHGKSPMPAVRATAPACAPPSGRRL